VPALWQGRRLVQGTRRQSKRDVHPLARVQPRPSFNA
jgi:hypothetical protein